MSMHFGFSRCRVLFLAGMAVIGTMLSTPVRAEQQENAPAAPAAPAVTGDPLRGAARFTGALPFSSGAAPCGACHALANRGIRGGTMAADLGGVFTPDSADSIKDIVGAIEAPVMKKIYTTHPLTDADYADLAAFARQPVPERQPDAGMTPVLPGAGFAVVVLLGLTLYKRRIG